MFLDLVPITIVLLVIARRAPQQASCTYQCIVHDELILTVTTGRLPAKRPTINPVMRYSQDIPAASLLQPQAISRLTEEHTPLVSEQLTRYG